MSATRSLIARLDAPTRRALEQAAELCVERTHYHVEIEHLLRRLLEQPGGGLADLARHHGVDPGRLAAELERSLGGSRRGHRATPALSPALLRLLEAAWTLASRELGEASVRGATVVLALLRDEALRPRILNSVPCLGSIPPEAIPGPGTQPEPGAAAGEEASALARYTLDLTEQARTGGIDPIRGREREIRQLIDILLRRRQNNPILTGEAGVGKTAVVEGFALKVAMGHVPTPLREIAVRTLDLGLLQAGAGVRGEFEQRLKSVIAEVQAAPRPVILFIDEAHALIGAGGQAGQGDAANLLKPALARGALRTIAATTWREYKRHIEGDPALARRFQQVAVAEPDEAQAIDMLRAVAPKLERHHEVRILDAALGEAVRLSGRYISARRLPDKAVSVLDTACARVAVAQRGTPPAVEAVAWEMSQLRARIAALRREESAGRSHGETLAALGARLDACHRSWEGIEARWQEEAALVARCLEMHRRLEASRGEGDEQWLRDEVQDLEQELGELQAEAPLVPLWVDGAAVADVVASWTGIPLGRMVRDEIAAVLGLREALGRRVVGQEQALEVISRRIRTYRAQLGEPDQPVGVFLLVGPSGVGKTEAAEALAERLYGGRESLIRLNMSEYQEAHAVSLLRGAPPGYVGHGAGGILTEAVRRRPYSVILLDEAEKAHPDVMELFHQVFDRGSLEDAEGIGVDFRNTIILLTSSLGAEAIVAACTPGGERPPVEQLIERIRPHLLGRFKAALLARMVITPFYPLGEAQMHRIVGLKLEAVCRRFQARHRAQMDYDGELVALIARRAAAVDSGARAIDAILDHELLPELATGVLEHMACGGRFQRVHVSVTGGGGFALTFLGPG